ncbi:MAG: Uma2 family endonuclease [Trebonia sp.]
MIVMTREPDEAQLDVLLEDFQSLDTPEGYRAEFIDGVIVVTPPPQGDHEDIVGQIVKQVFRKSLVEMDFAGHKGLIVPSSGAADGGRVIPDATFALNELRLFRGAEPWMKTAGVTMVVEVTSSNPERDRDVKRHAYASAGIPLYLLVDVQRHWVTLFRDPAGEDYRSADRITFGRDLELPEPFSFTLETENFAA